MATGEASEQQDVRPYTSPIRTASPDAPCCCGLAQVEALDRILTRLAMTEESALEGVLGKLLPRIIDQLKTQHARVRQARWEALGAV